MLLHNTYLLYKFYNQITLKNMYLYRQGKPEIQ